MLSSRDEDQLRHALGDFRLQAHNGVVPEGVEKGHRDGWGLFAYKRKSLIVTAKRPQDAVEDPHYAESVDEIAKNTPDIVIGHLRKASQGQRSRANTHPFSWNGVTFCHNGTVKNPSGILLTKEYEERCQGETDSERFFMFIMQCADGNTAREALRNGIKEALIFAHSSLNYTALNMLISNGVYLWAVREIDEPIEFVRRTNNLPSYYSLVLGSDGEQTCRIVASESLTAQGISWEPIENHHIVEIDQKNVLDVSRLW